MGDVVSYFHICQLYSIATDFGGFVDKGKAAVKVLIVVAGDFRYKSYAHLKLLRTIFSNIEITISTSVVMLWLRKILMRCPKFALSAVIMPPSPLH